MVPGDEYYGLNGECYREIISILSNPSSEVYGPFIQENIIDAGYDLDQLLSDLKSMVYDKEQDYYFDPDGSIGETYEDFLLTGLEDLNEYYPTSGSCAWEVSILTMISSTQNVDGF